MGRTVLDRPGLALFDESVTLATAALEKIGNEDEAAELSEAIADLIGRIEAWNVAPRVEQAAAPELDVPASMLRALTEYEEHRLRDNLERGRGIYVVENGHNRNKVPFLADIPLLGAAFRSSTIADERRELLIFVTPRIVVSEHRAS